jgi:hypothetical protein
VKWCYRLYSREILLYLEHAINKINKLKKCFRAIRLKAKNIKKSYFNFPKFHVFTHIVAFIKRYGTLDRFDAVINEVVYKF